MSEQHQDTFQRHLRHIPQLTPETWLVIIDGFVAKSLTLDYSTLYSLPATISQQLLMCAGHTPAEPLAQVVRWHGVALTEVLQRAVPDNRAQYINIYSADGYATSIPLDAAENALLAYEMNDAPLSPEHGFPARLVLDGRYGYKQPKWVQHIILSDTPVQGHWEQQGRDSIGMAPPTATVATLRLNVQAGKPITLHGLTNAPHVQVSVDGGSWNPATVSDDLRWRATWVPPLPGTYHLRVRAHQGTTTQPDTTQPVIMVQATA